MLRCRSLSLCMPESPVCLCSGTWKNSVAWCLEEGKRGRRSVPFFYSPSLWVCATQLCKDEPHKEGDQLRVLSGLAVEIHSWFSSLHTDKKKKKFWMTFCLKTA